MQTLIPKIELHAHFEGATSAPGGTAGLGDTNSDEGGGFADYAGFAQAWEAAANRLRTRQDFASAVAGHAAHAAACGAVYIESSSPRPDLTRSAPPWTMSLRATATGIERAMGSTGIEVRLTPDISLWINLDLAEQIVRKAVAFMPHGVVGIGVGGDERYGKISDYRRAIALAQESGLGFVPYAGEQSAQQLADAISLGAKRIRHGISASRHPSIVDQLLRAGIVLDVCMASNLKTGVVAAESEHPARGLVLAGSTVHDRHRRSGSLRDRSDPGVRVGGSGRRSEPGSGVRAAVKGALSDTALKAKLITVGRRNGLLPWPAFDAARPGPGTSRAGGVHNRRLHSQAQWRSTPGIGVPL